MHLLCLISPVAELGEGANLAAGEVGGVGGSVVDLPLFLYACGSVNPPNSPNIYSFLQVHIQRGVWLMHIRLKTQ